MEPRLQPYGNFWRGDGLANIPLPLKSIQQKSFTPPQPVEQAMP